MNKIEFSIAPENLNHKYPHNSAPPALGQQTYDAQTVGIPGPWWGLGQRPQPP